MSGSWGLKGVHWACWVRTCQQPEVGPKLMGITYGPTTSAAGRANVRDSSALRVPWMTYCPAVVAVCGFTVTAAPGSTIPKSRSTGFATERRMGVTFAVAAMDARAWARDAGGVRAPAI